MYGNPKTMKTYISNLDKAKNDAYFILSDAGQIKKRKVNLRKLVQFHKAEINNVSFKDSAVIGGISNDNESIILKTSKRLSPLEESFEIATTLAMMITYDAKTKLGIDRMFPHSIVDGTSHDPWQHATDVAMFILFYDVNPKEFKVLQHPKSEKLIAKLAKKKGMPTRHILKRISLEIA